MKRQYYWMQQYNNNQTWVQPFPDYDNDDDYGPWDTNDYNSPYDHYGNSTWKQKMGQGKGQGMGQGKGQGMGQGMGQGKGQGHPGGPMDHGKKSNTKSNAAAII